MKGEVYNQSLCVMNKVAYYYYIEGMSQGQIAEFLNISKPTVSRALKKAHEEKIVRISINEPFKESILLEQKLKDKYDLKEVIVLPLLEEEDAYAEEVVKKKVALETARYLQRSIRDGDYVGIAWGGTMYHVIQYLNPCRKVHANMITMHGSVLDYDMKFDVTSLVKRASMAFGGQNTIINDVGILPTAEHLKEYKKTEKYSLIKDTVSRIDIAVSGIGSLYPTMESPIIEACNLTDEQMETLVSKNVRGDLLLRFIDKNGEECDTPIKDRTLGMNLDEYKKVPCKVIAASGSQKAEPVLALLKGKLLDVLVVDYYLAKAIWELS